MNWVPSSTDSYLPPARLEPPLHVATSTPITETTPADKHVSGTGLRFVEPLLDYVLREPTKSLEHVIYHEGENSSSRGRRWRFLLKENKSGRPSLRHYINGGSDHNGANFSAKYGWGEGKAPHLSKIGHDVHIPWEWTSINLHSTQLLPPPLTVEELQQFDAYCHRLKEQLTLAHKMVKAMEDSHHDLAQAIMGAMRRVEIFHEGTIGGKGFDPIACGMRESSHLVGDILSTIHRQFSAIPSTEAKNILSLSDQIRQDRDQHLPILNKVFHHALYHYAERGLKPERGLTVTR